MKITENMKIHEQKSEYIFEGELLNKAQIAWSKGKSQTMKNEIKHTFCGLSN